MRLFVALDVPDAVRAALTEFVTPLKPLCRGARWVNLKGAHVTLKFIGEVSHEKLPEIQQALAEVRGGPLDLRFAGVGFFPNDRRPRVFWAGIESGPRLAALASAVDAALAPLGIPGEDRPFRPHLTLARFTSAEGVERLGDFFASRAEDTGGRSPVFGSARAAEFYFYQSVLKPAGAEYTRLAAYPLSGDSAS